MERLRNPKELLYGLHPYLLSSIATIALLLQIVLGLVLHSQPKIASVANLGWGIWALGVAFAVIPIFTFRRKGGVPAGKSFIHTTVLVDTGIYAICRHPQGGLAPILFGSALMLIIQHWLAVLLGVIMIGLFYADTFKLDQSCIEKFGPEYLRYMQRVPRVNFVSGVARLLRRRVSA